MNAARSSGRALALAVDVGGSSLRFALVRNGGGIVRGSWRRSAVSGDESAAALDRLFLGTLTELIQLAAAAGTRVDRIGIAMPGPFDYVHGISRMTHKFAAWHGQDVRRRLADGLAPVFGGPIRFLHDAAALLWGECRRDPGLAQGRVLCLTIGTGLGAACLEDGVLLLQSDGMPWLSAWDRPCRDGIAEDYVGKDALLGNYRRRGPRRPVGNVAQLAARARHGDPAALAAFADMGHDLGLAIGSVLAEFPPRRLLLGGGIAHAFDLFGPALRLALSRHAGTIAIAPAAQIDRGALRGAAEWAGRVVGFPDGGRTRK